MSFTFEFQTPDLTQIYHTTLGHTVNFVVEIQKQ